MSLRVFLSGGNGMVGRNILDHARKRGWTVFAPRRSEVDLADQVQTERYIGEIKPDLVIHAAGRVGGIQANMRDPVAFLVENIDVGRNVILAAWRQRVPRLINLASSCIYPREGASPLREEDVLTGQLEPTNEGYALAKIVALRLCEYINKMDSTVQYKTVIPCNLYGRYDHFNAAVAHLVPSALLKVDAAKKAGIDEVEIWGDGTVRREFMYAGDIADAVIRLGEIYESAPDVMNVGLGTDYSVLEYYQMAAEVVGWNGRWRFDTSKPVGMRQKLISVERQMKWGWQFKTSLRDGMQLAYDYYLNEAQK
jgi:GDP-L-fucose synthase